MSPHSFRLSSRFSSGRLAAALVVLVLAGCAGTSKRVVYDPEEFDSTTTHARGYTATEAQTCEAARRALLSQGYLITAANPDLVTGRKSFQPASEVHVEVEFRVVCQRASVDSAEQALHELHRELGRAVAHVQRRVDLDHVQRASRPVSAIISMHSCISR
jgi:predicted CoA-binding protein